MNTIIDTISIWTTAQKLKTSGRGRSASNQSLHGINKLRELILELAVQGKLVPQDPNDEPASILLEKIDKEKKRLIKEGKIRKQIPFQEISKDEMLFNLPVSWQWTHVGEIGNIFNGNSINAKVKEEKYSSSSEGLPFIATKDVEYGWEPINYNNGIVIPENEQGFSVAHSGAVFICAEGGSAGKKCGIAIKDVYFGNKLFAIELYGNILSKYILANYLCPFFFGQFSKSMTGIIGGISLLKFIQLFIPVPPLAEQHRIVAKVDELMALCDKLEQQQTDSNSAHEILVETLLDTLTNAPDHAELEIAWQRISSYFDVLFTTEHSIDRLKQTILQLAVMGKLVPQNPDDEPASVLIKKIAKEKARLVKEGKIRKQELLPKITEDKKPFLLPINWEFSRLENIVNITSGVTKGRKLTGRDLITVPYLSVANVQRGYLELDFIKEIEIPEEELRKFTVVERDLLITEGGDWDKVGRTAIWKGELPVTIHQNHIFKARCILEEQNEIWLEKYLNSTLAREYFAKSSKQTTNLASINQTQLRGCIIAIPPLAEQHRIVSKVDELFAICDALKERINESQVTLLNLADVLVDGAVKTDSDNPKWFITFRINKNHDLPIPCWKIPF